MLPLNEVVDKLFSKFSSNVAFSCMNTDMTYKELENLSGNFASYLTNVLKLSKGSKIAFWVVVLLSILKLAESFLATVGDPEENLGWYWYLVLTGGIEVAVLIHLLNPKARAELSNQ